MIASLRGKVIFMGVNRVVVEAQGVGYDVAVSLSTRDALPEHEEVFLHIHTAMRDNALELFGFTTLEEKRLFEMLLTVAGVGPRTSLQVLSGISPEGFCQAVLDGDTRQLVSIPGIGKKSAERIILELKEKIRKLPVMGQDRTGKTNFSSLEEDLVSSLINLGYMPRAAEATAKSVLKNGGSNLTLSEAVRAALKEASK
jgi:holliday junction DNA helicase RuvA